MRFIAGCILASFVAAVMYLATLRTERHPLLIDAKDPWCDFREGGPLIDTPRGNYDYQPRKRRIGVTA